MKAHSAKFLSIPLLTALAISAAQAQIALDDDNASRAPYIDSVVDENDNGSTTGGGSGFGGWQYGDNTLGNFDIASSGTNGGLATIDNGTGSSFRLWDSTGSGVFIDSVRAFDGGILGVGQSLSFQMDVNFRDGFKGVNVRGADFSTQIFQFQTETAGYIVNGATTGGGSLFGATYDADTVFSLVFTQTSLTNGDWFITRSGGLSGSASGTYTGRISSFQLFTTATTNPSIAAENAILFNNFSVVPEPGTFALLSGFMALGYLMLRRRS